MNAAYDGRAPHSRHPIGDGAVVAIAVGTVVGVVGGPAAPLCWSVLVAIVHRRARVVAACAVLGARPNGLAASGRTGVDDG